MLLGMLLSLILCRSASGKVSYIVKVPSLAGQMRYRSSCNDFGFGSRGALALAV